MCVCACVLAQSFQSFVGKDESFPESVRNLVSASYDPVYKFHQGFLKEVEQRLAQWSVFVGLSVHFLSLLALQDQLVLLCLSHRTQKRTFSREYGYKGVLYSLFFSHPLSAVSPS